MPISSVAASRRASSVRVGDMPLSYQEPSTVSRVLLRSSRCSPLCSSGANEGRMPWEVLASLRNAAAVAGAWPTGPAGPAGPPGSSGPNEGRDSDDDFRLERLPCGMNPSFALWALLWTRLPKSAPEPTLMPIAGSPSKVIVLTKTFDDDFFFIVTTGSFLACRGLMNLSEFRRIRSCFLPTSIGGGALGGSGTTGLLGGGALALTFGFGLGVFWGLFAITAAAVVTSAGRPALRTQRSSSMGSKLSSEGALSDPTLSSSLPMSLARDFFFFFVVAPFFFFRLPFPLAFFGRMRLPNA
mmetsp:Transcript_35248/g.110963  ORF Transcript_35248/g.110963 Transcript_35248/m.110963 type:complete len:298 (+) Transcript_35248:3452-4345(+)